MKKPIMGFFSKGRSRPFVFLIALSFTAACLAQDARSVGWVVLPIDDYRSLHARAYPAEKGPEPSSVDATLTRVDYDLRINNEVATGKADLTVDVLKDGWVRVPIPAGLLVREAKRGECQRCCLTPVVRCSR
jgi:hypothetical protein